MKYIACPKCNRKVIYQILALSTGDIKYFNCVRCNHTLIVDTDYKSRLEKIVKE